MIQNLPNQWWTQLNLPELTRHDRTIVEDYWNPADDCAVIITRDMFGNYDRHSISGHVMRREFPRPDPTVEAFVAVATALHEQRKRTDRQQDDALTAH